MEKSISRKILVIGLISLFLGASATIGVSATGAWTENFDSYAAGSALSGQGGWHGWDDVATVTGYVSNAQSRSPANSVEIAWFGGNAADQVHDYNGVDSGIWTYTAYQYVPSVMTGNTYFILLNTYVTGTHNNPDWSLQLVSCASLGTIVDFDDAEATLPLVTDAWAEIKVVIDFDTDWQTITYNGEPLQAKSWTEGVYPGGAKNLAAVDLYADSAVSTSVYYDDLSVLPAGEELLCDAGGDYSCEIGHAINFTGFASGGIVPYTWAWAFGDGNTSIVQNPTHTYGAPGVYNVTLTVTDAAMTSVSDQALATVTEIQLVPELEISTITGGFGVKAVIKNTGTGAATNVDWTIALDGKLVFLGKSSPGTIPSIAAGAESSIKSKLILGFGKTNIVVSATCDEGATAELTKTAFVLGPLVLSVK